MYQRQIDDGTRLVLAACSIFLLSDAAHWVDVRERTTGIRDLSPPPRSRRDGPLILREVVGLHGEEGFKEMDMSLPTAQGSRIVKMQETYGGLPVFDTIVTTEIEADSEALTGEMSGWIVENIADDIFTINPNLTQKEAILIAKLRSGLLQPGTIFGAEIGELEIYVDKAGKAALVYRVEFHAEANDGYFRPVFIIESNTGECLDTWNDVETYPSRGLGGNGVTGIRHYGKEFPFLDVTKDGDLCRLENNKVKVVDMKFKESVSDDAPAMRFDCKAGPTDKVNGAFSPSSDAFFFGTKAYDMFTEWAHIRPLKKKQVLLRVHFGKNTVNALWDGSGVSLGDGNPKKGYYPLVVIDTLTHELAHGFTAAHSQLIYKGQSGAVSEAFSDIAGEAGEMYINGHNDWVSGADIVIKGGSMRDFCEPFGAAIGHASNYVDNMDVHYSSGVVLKAFCYLGKTARWKIQDIFQVFTVANRFYWHPSTNFTDAACGLAKATYDIGLDTNDIEAAFSQVGVTTCKTEGYVRTLHADHEVRNLAGKERKHGLFKIKLSSGFLYKYLRVVTIGGAGDVDVLVSFNRKDNMKWKSTHRGNKELVKITRPKHGRYFVKLVAKNSGSYSGVSLYYVTRVSSISNNVH